MDGKRKRTVNSRPVEYGMYSSDSDTKRKKNLLLYFGGKKQVAFDPFVHRLPASSLNEKIKSWGVGTKR